VSEWNLCYGSRMAELLEGDEAELVRRTVTYPWDQWIDGHARRFVQGEDFQTTTRAFATQIRRAAWSRGWQTQINREGSTVTVRMAPRTDAGWTKPQRTQIEGTS